MVYVHRSSLRDNFCDFLFAGTLVAQWVKPWPADLADRVQSPLEPKSSQP